MPETDIAERLELLREEIRIEDALGAALVGIPTWRVIEAENSDLGTAYPRWYVSATPPDWRANPLASYSNTGIWSDKGTTTREIADFIAAHSPSVMARVADERLAALTVIEALPSLKRDHAPSCALDENEERDCDCGAPAHNARIDDLLFTFLHATSRLP